MRVLWASDQMPVCSALKRLMSYDSELSVIREVFQADGLLSRAQDSRVDWVLLDWELPTLRAADPLAKLHGVCGVVVFGKNEARHEALAAKINAFIDEEEPLERWVDILRINGGLTPSFAQ